METWLSAVVLALIWMDGPCMSQDQFNQFDLTENQYFRIVEVLKDYGNDIPKNGFPEYVLRLVEDIPGLELISDSEAQSIINKLWSLYHDQSK